jgi:hypothetical protein
MPSIRNSAFFKIITRCAAATFAVLLAEIFIFNCSSVFKPGFPVSNLDLNTAKGNPQDLHLSGAALHSNPKISAFSFYFDDIDMPSETITFEVSARAPSVIRGKIYLKDDQFSQNFREVYNILFTPSDKKQTVFAKIKSYGNLKSAAFGFYKTSGADLIITAVRLNQAKPFNFSFLRFFLILFILLLIIFCKYYGWHNYETDFKDKAYKLSSAVTLTLLAVISFSIFTAINSTPAWLNQKTSYPFNPQDKIEDPYLLVFDAFKKG